MDMFKHQKIYKIRDSVKERFYQFCTEYSIELGTPFNDYTCCEEIINNLKEDFDNFLSEEDYQLKFKYPFEKFRNKKSLSEDNYKKLKENYSEEEQVYYVIYDKLKNIFSKLSENIDTSNISTNLTAKELHNYNYFIESQPRCCFCGQLLEISEKEGERYIHADIEHILPKNQFPQYILHPSNWAPCCKECNIGEKRTEFFNDSDNDENIRAFKRAFKDLGIELNNIHPLQLWKSFFLNCVNNKYEINYLDITSDAAKNFINFYGIEKRMKIIISRCYTILFNIIKHSDIRSPESLERLLENIASSNWHEINDGYSLNNSPKIWQEFIESILYDECKLIALWDEVKSSELRFL